MKELHLIQKDKKLLPWPKEKGSDEYESGYWAMPPYRAQEAVGADIYFHEKQVDGAFFGGRVTGFRIQPDEPWAGRIIFSLLPDQAYKGKKTGRTGWSMEMKTVE